VARRVPVRLAVAAPHVAAREAEPQVHPAGALREAFLAAARGREHGLRPWVRETAQVLAHGSSLSRGRGKVIA
jgi:hypothetical protein